MVCTLPASSPSSGSSVTPPGTSTPGRSAGRGQRHHHRGQALVAGGDAEHALARGQRAHQAAQHDRGVVAVRQGVHHAGRALRAAVAGIGAGAGERDGVQRLQLARGFGHQQADFPMAGVIAERDGRAVCSAQAAVRAEDQELRVEQPRRVPAHAGVLRQAEEVAGGRVEQHLRRDGQLPGGPGA